MRKARGVNLRVQTSPVIGRGATTTPILVHRQLRRMSARWLIIDTDAGVDDAVALCAGLKLQKDWGYEMKGITTSFGNTALENVNLNVRKVVTSCMKDIAGPTSSCPIYPGAERGLKGETADASYFHGKDGLGDAEYKEPVEATLEMKGAVEGIVGVAEEAKREGAELTVVTDRKSVV